MKDSKRPLSGIPPATRCTQPYPSFRLDNHAVGAGAATSVKALTVFNSNVACTVLHILVQTSAACTLQLLLNGQPFSVAITVGAGAIIRFAGVFVANNETLAVSVTANSTLNFEVVWVKDIHPEHITTDTAVVYAGSATGGNTNVDIFDSTGLVLNSNGAGALKVDGSLAPEPLVKKTTIESTTLLAANATFTGAWHDSIADGTCYVTATEFSAQVGAANGLVIQECDDISGASIPVANLTRNATFSTTTAATLNRCYSVIKCRYWRIVYTNGATLQTTFELTSTAMNIPWQMEESGYGSVRGQEKQIPFITPTTTVNEPFTQSAAVIVNQTGTGFPLASQTLVAISGVSMQMLRTPSFFKQVSTAATGSTALWTPTAGKKFRLMRYRICVTQLAKAAAAADLVINLLDAAAAFGQSTVVTIQTTAGTVGGLIMDSGWIDLGNGFLSAAANNVLNLSLSFALTGGLVNITAVGTEE